MSIEDCLRAAHRQGAISKDDFEDAKREYQRLLAHYGDPDLAKDEMIRRRKAAAEHREREDMLQDGARSRIQDFFLKYRNRAGEPDAAEAMVALLESNGQVIMPPGFSSVGGRAKAILGLEMGRIETLLNETRRTKIMGGPRNLALLDNVVREAAGEGTGDAQAKTLADALLQVFNDVRERANAAGASIGELQGWFMPQVHDRLALIAAKMPQWKSDLLGDGSRAGWLDLEKMRHPMTGEQMTREDVDEALNWVFDEITTDGWAHREATHIKAGDGSVTARRARHRFLHFKDAESWMAYQAAYGGGADPLSAMMKHIKGMADDIAAMEILGPRPEEMLAWMQNVVTRQGNLRAAGNQAALLPTRTSVLGREITSVDNGSWIKTKSPTDYAAEMNKLAQDMWDIYRGTADAVVNERVANLFGAVRNLNVANLLGGAVLSAAGDIGTQQVARAFTGLPVARTYGDVISSFSNGTRREAVRAGLILDTALNMVDQKARWAGSLHGPVWSRFLAGRVLAWQGLDAWTQTGKHAFGLAIQAELAGRTHVRFDDLDRPLRYFLQRYGIDDMDWDMMRLSPDGQPLDVDFLRPTDIRVMRDANSENGRFLADRYLEAILQETEYAVPQGTLRAHAEAYGGLRRGVPRDELYRSMGQFKMFGISSVLLNGQRVATEAVSKGIWQGAGWAAAILVAMTIYGGLSVQLKRLKEGKDPKPMDDEFWGQAILQGGGLGIYGDFLASEQNRMGGGLAGTIAGPTIGGVGDILSLTLGNAGEWYRGENSNLGREAVKFLERNTPGASIWYLRLAYKRAVIDTLQEMADPEAYNAWRRQMRKEQRENDAGFWSAPGSGADFRAPDLKNALPGVLVEQ
jgi:hypothetical protein